MSEILEIYNYWIYIVLMMVGFYGVIAKRNLIKQAIALGLFQTGIFLFYISMAVVDGGTAPIWVAEGVTKIPDPLAFPPAYDNPLPHVLMLTAIVVGVSILAVALAIIINIRRAYGTIEYDEIAKIEREMEIREAQEAAQ